MGYNTTAATQTLLAKLTPLGRQLLVSTNNRLITSFSLGDSDANYNASIPLSTGQIPAEAGDVGTGGLVSNSTQLNTRIKSLLKYNTSGLLQKPVETQSAVITSEQIAIGMVTVSGTNLSQITINRNDYLTDSYVNLFYSFGLPLNTIDDKLYTGTTFANGGYSDTSLSAIAQTKIVVLGINNSQYGETIDGKTVKIVLPTSAGTYTMYSTFENKGVALTTEDVNLRETSTLGNPFGDNIAFIFSDDILRPNGGDPTLSWSTGYGLVKPFSLNSKRLYNLQTNTNVAMSADTLVGVAYLDKGLVAITNPTIVNNFSTAFSTGATITLDSVSTSVFQNITCIAGRGEFGSSTNTTFGVLDNPRISEVGLYDSVGNIIAIAKTDRHIVKNVNEFVALGIKIVI